MKKLVLIGLIPLSIWCMQKPKHRKSWDSYSLKDLMDAAKSATETEANEKHAYAEFCKDIYEKAKVRLNEITVSTGGYIFETQDPAIETKMSRKAVYLNQNVLECSPHDIEMLRFRIEILYNDYNDAIEWRNNPRQYCLIS